MEENNKVVSSIEHLLDARKPFSSKELIENAKSAILEGHVNPLEGYTVLKRMSKISEEVFKDNKIKQLALDEAKKHLGGGKTKSFDIYSAQICVGSTYTYYDFSQCGHEILDKLRSIELLVKESIKTIEEELKLMIPSEKDEAKIGIDFGIKSFDKEIVFSKMPQLMWEDYGVVGTVKPPRKLSTEGLKYLKI